MIRLQLWNHQEQLRVQAREQGLIQPEPTSALNKLMQQRRERFLDNVMTSPKDSISDFAEFPMELLDRSTQYHWLDFFIGMLMGPFAFFVPSCKKSHPGIKHGKLSFPFLVFKDLYFCVKVRGRTTSAWTFLLLLKILNSTINW